MSLCRYMCRHKQQTEVTYTRENKTRGYAHAVLVRMHREHAWIQKGGGAGVPLLKLNFIKLR